ncbi:MAG TPA: hypothetical protein VMD56_07900 [Steroidobacteraceae bacterium]|nr:hypothetical protein [Steroidobacteraceae bacterium]
MLVTTILLAACAIMAAAELVIDWRRNDLMMRMGLACMIVITAVVLVAGASL